MTKEELLISNIGSYNTSELPVKIIFGIREAMDAYARQEAAAFAEFINKKKYYQSYITGFWYPTNMEEEAPQLSTNQLYDLYLTHKNKSDVKS